MERSLYKIKMALATPSPAPARHGRAGSGVHHFSLRSADAARERAQVR